MKIEVWVRSFGYANLHRTEAQETRACTCLNRGSHVLANPGQPNPAAAFFGP